MSDGDDRRLVLSNARAARTFDIGTSWTSLMLGVRMSINGSSANIASANMVFGACSGVANVYGDQTPKHIVGLKVNNGGSAWTFGSHFWAPSAKALVNVSGVDTLYGTPSGSNYTSDVTLRVGHFVKIDKGSPNFTVTWAGCTFSAATDLTLNQFQSLMETAIANFSTVKGNYGQQGTVSTVAVNEGTNGSLDSCCFYWSNVGETLEISDVAYARLA